MKCILLIIPNSKIFLMINKLLRYWSVFICMSAGARAVAAASPRWFADTSTNAKGVCRSASVMLTMDHVRHGV